MMALLRLGTCIHNDGPGRLQSVRNHDVLATPLGLGVEIAVHGLIESNDMHVVVDILATCASDPCFHVVPCGCTEESRSLA